MNIFKRMYYTKKRQNEFLKVENDSLKELWEIDRNKRYLYEEQINDIKEYIETHQRINKRDIERILIMPRNIKLEPSFVDALTTNIFTIGERYAKIK